MKAEHILDELTTQRCDNAWWWLGQQCNSQQTLTRTVNADLVNMMSISVELLIGVLAKFVHDVMK